VSLSEWRYVGPEFMLRGLYVYGMYGLSFGSHVIKKAPFGASRVGLGSYFVFFL
jgi:hypothetical protein